MENTREMERVWASVDLAALTENVTALKRLLPDGCAFLAVVKANAYGHGDRIISRHLQDIGVRNFAVATLEEGIRLREAGITGMILILGYTAPALAGEIAGYELTQTVVDFRHAKELNERGIPLKVHLKIDTGMHRLGITPEHFSEILEIFSMENLTVSGMFTHLCAADSLADGDVAFSQRQIAAFFDLKKHLERALAHPKLTVHIQSSYGILNYPGLPCDFARVGILMYGCFSDRRREVRMVPTLRPVLSLKARIAAIHELADGESVGYGRTWTARGRRRIAVVPVGYADGYPRALSVVDARNGSDEARGTLGPSGPEMPGRPAGVTGSELPRRPIGAAGLENSGPSRISAGPDVPALPSVLICEQYAPIAGRICMDQMMVDVTEIPQAAPGQIVTLIGKDGQREILAEEVAEWAGTITNELLSRLGPRIPRVEIPS